MNISLRLLHLKKQPAWKKPVVKALQTALHSSFVGPLFFGLLAKPNVSPHTSISPVFENKQVPQLAIALGIKCKRAQALLLIGTTYYSDGFRCGRPAFVAGFCDDLSLALLQRTL